MEQLNARIYEKYRALKKRKLNDEEAEREREANFKRLFDELKDWISVLEKENKESADKLEDKQGEIEKAREDFLEALRSKDTEIQRLRQLLSDKNDKINSPTSEFLDKTPEVVLENPSAALPNNKTPQSNKRTRFSENAVPQNSSESRELECSRRTCITGNSANESSSSHMLLLMLQCVARMKISVNDGTERFSVSISHEATGYCFTLTWLEKHGEWSYKPSSLGTLERTALEWMRHDIRFSMNMFGKFFERILSIIKKG